MDGFVGASSNPPEGVATGWISMLRGGSGTTQAPLAAPIAPAAAAPAPIAAPVAAQPAAARPTHTEVARAPAAAAAPLQVKDGRVVMDAARFRDAAAQFGDMLANLGREVTTQTVAVQFHVSPAELLRDERARTKQATQPNTFTVGDPLTGLAKPVDTGVLCLIETGTCVNYFPFALGVNVEGCEASRNAAAAGCAEKFNFIIPPAPSHGQAYTLNKTVTLFSADPKNINTELLERYKHLTKESLMAGIGYISVVAANLDASADAAKQLPYMLVPAKGDFMDIVRKNPKILGQGVDVNALAMFGDKVMIPQPAGERVIGEMEKRVFNQMPVRNLRDATKVTIYRADGLPWVSDEDAQFNGNSVQNAMAHSVKTPFIELSYQFAAK